MLLSGVVEKVEEKEAPTSISSASSSSKVKGRVKEKEKLSQEQIKILQRQKLWALIMKKVILQISYWHTRFFPTYISLWIDQSNQFSRTLTSIVHIFIYPYLQWRH